MRLSLAVLTEQHLLIKALRLSPFNRRNLDLHALFTFPGVAVSMFVDAVND